ncbi:MAG: hypothetical protein A2172_04065 [Candidatus Woykebacteria bacterium RBG_13_40_15]|uniref:Uncharacterized protein n=1 Tax=Candidatus Woykebacteria bacterium RBG_13_40_15 TaxID=1802593 RepID=A0A1G1W6Q9_9BACT|nr:MAG: hypothetical protein A2172_04065 [Candidatus Woykebacteria bacterium RBG_13_40_15]
MTVPAVTIYLAKLPIEFFIWWFWEAPITLLKILKFIFLAFAHLFSLKSLFTTFFKPWKNEYREGLVRTAIFIGATIKTLLIIFDFCILSLVLVIEAVVFFAWFALPILALVSLYGAIFAK